MIPKELLEAYLATEYRVFAPDKIISFRANKVSPALARLQYSFNSTGSAFITAYNPFSQPTSEATNRQNHERLIAEIAPHWKYLLGEGVDLSGKWPAEPSILIFGIHIQPAIALGRQFGQNAILFSDAQGEIWLHACDPKAV